MHTFSSCNLDYVGIVETGRELYLWVQHIRTRDVYHHHSNFDDPGGGLFSIDRRPGKDKSWRSMAQRSKTV